MRENNKTKDYSIRKSEDRLEIEIRLSILIRHYRNSVLLNFVVSLLCFIILLVDFVFFLILYLLFIVVFILPFIITYVYYNITTYNLSFTKSSQLIEVLRDHRYFVKKKSLNIKDIESIVYQDDYSYDHPNVYKIFLVGANFRHIRIYKGEKEDCKKIGLTISKFIGKPLKLKK